ncbi:AGE family epimerase/isomerase [Phenylobacterium sp.]|uniref:AGE family epimerase/isomerase n=1 Tax=Phenylobacterium sp. TaxID=1871053 RepID=UPI0025E2C95E|nr:AGE family epimerase/isomerase [Phenylobacterium sp.]
MRTPAASVAAKETSILPPVYPVILCGGSGARLWPASRPWRPKPFLRLVGPRSGFQAAVLRAQPLATGGMVVVGGAVHAGLIGSQLAEIGFRASVLLEPAGRDTAAAIAAAAAWVAARAPDAILAILPADHHIPDAEAFAEALRQTLAAADGGAIVTLGVRPASASSAYGYIRPAAAGTAVTPIAAFVEKPLARVAAALLAEGALWNSGTFVAAARTLLTELARWAPQVAERAQAAVDGATPAGEATLLGAAFVQAPKIAFDRAVMEQTAHGAVLPVDFAWSDLGAWDAVLAASGDGVGPGATVTGGANVLARAAPGMRLAVVGVSNIAVVAEADAVLVCALDQSQAVRDLAAEQGPPARYASLAVAAGAYDVWLRTSALPLWATVGVDPATGGFREALTWAGVPDDPRRRARVQARQAFVFASAAAEGVPGPWLATARAGMDFYLRHARRPDGLFAATLDLAGVQGDAAAPLYDHAFILLALAGLRRADPADEASLAEATAVRARLMAFRHPAGGFRETGLHPFQANAPMHLFEAVLAWEAADGGAAWSGLADEIAGLALARFIDPASGALREVFDADWQALTGEAGLIEPGHQFEWAWLLERWGRSRGDAAARAAARRLFAAGRRGFDPQRGVVANALWDDLSLRDPAARLWPQTEHLKAALVLGEDVAALEAANGLAVYLDTPARGVWRERMRPDGGFLDEPAPATSLYHLYLAIRELTRAVGDPC